MITVREGDVFETDLSHAVPEGSMLAFHGGRTWFVRHGIPGERVRVRVTEVGDRIGRADVIEVVVADLDRRQPPCTFAGVCGGCDYQHMSLERQRAVKSDVLQDALRRQGGMSDAPRIPVQPLPGHEDGLHWRQRMAWQHDDQGRRGLYRHRSHDLVVIDECLIADPRAASVVPGEFAQAHSGLVGVLRERIIALGQPARGERWWDLYAGSGALTPALLAAVAPTGQVDLVEHSAASIKAVSLDPAAHLHIHHADVGRWVRTASTTAGMVVDGVVVDPPRAGLRPAIIADIARCRPRSVISISCHPVSFARDLKVFAEQGYRAVAIEAYDAYPMTWHMEIVAALVPDHGRDQIPLPSRERTRVSG